MRRSFTLAWACLLESPYCFCRKLSPCILLFPQRKWVLAFKNIINGPRTQAVHTKGSMVSKQIWGNTVNLASNQRNANWETTGAHFHWLNEQSWSKGSIDYTSSWWVLGERSGSHAVGGMTSYKIFRAQYKLENAGSLVQELLIILRQQ